MASDVGKPLKNGSVITMRREPRARSPVVIRSAPARLQALSDCGKLESELLRLELDVYFYANRWRPFVGARREAQMWLKFTGLQHAYRLSPARATKINVLRLHLLATHFGGGLSSDQPLLLPPSVKQMVVRKLADSPRGSEHNIKS